jgi:peroxiredoxin
MDMVEVDFPVLMDETGKISASWNVLMYPATYVIAPDGRIAYAVNGAIHWDSEEVINMLDRLILDSN